MLLTGCSPTTPPYSDDSQRLDEAATLVIETIDRTLSEWESAARAALEGGPLQVPAGVALVVMGPDAVLRSQGLTLPFEPTTPVAERPAVDSLTPDARAGFPVATVLADGWASWKKTAGGRAAEARGQSGVAVAWQTRGDRLAVVAGPIALLARASGPGLEALRVRAGIEDPAVSTRPASAGERVVPLTKAGLPWVVRLTAMTR